jgi:hypothetical protein
MGGRPHLTNSLADDFLNDSLSEKDQSAVTLHLEGCRDCRMLIVLLLIGTERLVRLRSSIESLEIGQKLRLYRKWMQGPEGKVAGGRSVLWP